tara:strand:+ start:154 stop:327 length:174 start_codon:yes stop_codon:yes gene_type:complete
MAITIQFDTDNAAFDSESYDYEVMKILHDLAGKDLSPGSDHVIRDSNGNSIGKAWAS